MICEKVRLFVNAPREIQQIYKADAGTSFPTFMLLGILLVLSSQGSGGSYGSKCDLGLIGMVHRLTYDMLGHVVVCGTLGSLVSSSLSVPAPHSRSLLPDDRLSLIESGLYLLSIYTPFTCIPNRFHKNLIDRSMITFRSRSTLSKTHTPHTHSLTPHLSVPSLRFPNSHFTFPFLPHFLMYPSPHVTKPHLTR